VLARYRYDGMNRRIARQDASGVWTYFTLLLSGETAAEFGLANGQVVPIRDYAWLDGRPIAQVEHFGAIPSQDRTFLIHSDHLGLPRAMTNAEGQLVWQGTVLPSGEVVASTIADAPSGRTVVTNLRLPGQYDERLFAAAGLTGLQGPYYNWNRWYLPGVGRYLEPDPLALGGGFNTPYGVDWYGYANQNPLSTIDQEGLSGSRPGGPYHPPEGVRLKCTPLDSCSTLMAKMDQFKRMIDSHTGWDRNSCKPNGGSRHVDEIDDLWNGYARCQAEYASRCDGGSPVFVPIPSPFPDADPIPYPVPGYPRRQQPSPATGGAAALLLLIVILLSPVGA